jgi:uncharacterized protein YbjT (DUF2867 family)
MNVLIVGATGGSGRAATAAAVAEGHRVTVFARRASALLSEFPSVVAIDGDAMNPGQVAAAVAGQDAVIVTLGISENPLRVRLRGSRHTPMEIRSAGTRNVIAAMQSHAVRRLVVQTSYGVGETRERLPLVERMVFALLLRPQIADTEVQERDVRGSGLDWVIVQPVNLTNRDVAELPYASMDGDTRGMKVARSSVGRFLVQALDDERLTHRSVSLSGVDQAFATASAAVSERRDETIRV